MKDVAENTQGTFVVSLDFELYWGMTDKVTLEEYGENIRGVRIAIPRMLALFEKYGIHATWATVGMLTFDTKEQLLAALPSAKPTYTDTTLSNYLYLETASIGTDEETDKYHFGASLVREIQKHPNQEIASHTFSHYYCKEEGQDVETFRADAIAEQKALARFNVTPTSLVLPRNQWRADYLPVCRELGITAFRGNQFNSIYEARPEKTQTSLFTRALRLLDHYLPLFGSHTYTAADMKATQPYNIPASLFFRPYNPTLAFLEWLRRSRITNAMTVAAKEGKLFHLWWHPHNFGIHIEENLANLEHVLRHFQKLQKRCGMESKHMAEVAQTLAV